MGVVISSRMLRTHLGRRENRRRKLSKMSSGVAVGRDRRNRASQGGKKRQIKSDIRRTVFPGRKKKGKRTKRSSSSFSTYAGTGEVAGQSGSEKAPQAFIQQERKTELSRMETWASHWYSEDGKKMPNRLGENARPRVGLGCENATIAKGLFDRGVQGR